MNSIYLKKEIFCININIFVTFDQIIASSRNKSINFLQNPNFWRVTIIWR